MLWHETQGPLRPVLQALLQIAVAHIHLERGNLKGATVLLGEGLGRLAPCGEAALGIDLAVLRKSVAARLNALQLGEPSDLLPPPRLLAQAPPQPPVD
jgi:predicted metal-dependent hydrolase